MFAKGSFAVGLVLVSGEHGSVSRETYVDVSCIEGFDIVILQDLEVLVGFLPSSNGESAKDD